MTEEGEACGFPGECGKVRHSFESVNSVKAEMEGMEASVQVEVRS